MHGCSTAPRNSTRRSSLFAASYTPPAADPALVALAPLVRTLLPSAITVVVRERIELAEAFRDERALFTQAAHEAEVALFEAVIARYGDTVDFTTLAFSAAAETALLDHARQLLSQTHRGVGSLSHDLRLRNRNRVAAHDNAAIAWSAWGERAPGYGAGGTARHVGLRGAVTPCHRQQPELAATSDPRELYAALAQVLSAPDLNVLVAHYVDELPIDEIARRELRASDLDAADERSLVQARNRVKKRLQRAKLRAAAKLPQKWAVVAQEIDGVTAHA